MENTIVRFVKPLALSAICFTSIFYLTKNIGTAFIISLVPMLLGWLGIMETFAYAIASIVFLTAIAWAVTPPSVKEILSIHSERAVNEVKRELDGR